MLADNIIIASAYLHHFTVVTNIEKDFKKLSGIKMINALKL